MQLTKRNIMDSNRFKQELVNLRKEIESASKEREYTIWKEKTDAAIVKINSRIRATN